jgi:hypothetical protein
MPTAKVFSCVVKELFFRQIDGDGRSSSYDHSIYDAFDPYIDALPSPEITLFSQYVYATTVHADHGSQLVGHFGESLPFIYGGGIFSKGSECLSMDGSDTSGPNEDQTTCVGINDTLDNFYQDLDKDQGWDWRSRVGRRKFGAHGSGNTLEMQGVP